MTRSRQGHGEKARYWRGVISKAARSGLSIQAFCKAEGVSAGQFYVWRRKLKARERVRQTGSPRGATSFALVSDGKESASAGIELVLAGGSRLRISKGVDRETLAEVVAVLDGNRC
ncbi:MAG: IS66 family insertion sequence element accessory protein TnpB [Candidatus Eisenbacteria bacterium]